MAVDLTHLEAIPKGISTTDQAIAASQAISLKRIADALELLSHNWPAYVTRQPEEPQAEFISRSAELYDGLTKDELRSLDDDEPIPEVVERAMPPLPEDYFVWKPTKERPKPVLDINVEVAVIWRDGIRRKRNGARPDKGAASSFLWEHTGGADDIVAFKHIEFIP